MKINWQPLINYLNTHPNHGLTDGQLSIMFGIKAGSIGNWCYRNNIERQNNPPAIDPVALNSIYEQNPGINDYEAAKRLETNQGRIRYWREKFGIKSHGKLQKFIRAFDRKHGGEGALMRFVAMRKHGKTFEFLGTEFGFSKQAANQIWRKYRRLTNARP